jgi:hypothetical protein
MAGCITCIPFASYCYIRMSVPQLCIVACGVAMFWPVLRIPRQFGTDPDPFPAISLVTFKTA